jgi:hypothetical protein
MKRFFNLVAGACVALLALNSEGAVTAERSSATEIAVHSVAPEKPAPAANIDCRSNGANHQPYNRKSKVFAGKEGFGFRDADDCKVNIKAFNLGAVCNWNGEGYTPYDSRRGDAPIGKKDFGFSAAKSCATAVVDAARGLLCNWNGTGYSPYRVRDGGIVGKTDFGFVAYADCASTVQRRVRSVACNWNGSNYQPYFVKSNTPVGQDGFGYTRHGDCMAATEAAGADHACNWDGVGYSRYRESEPVKSVARFSTLSACLE